MWLGSFLFRVQSRDLGPTVHFCFVLHAAVSVMWVAGRLALSCLPEKEARERSPAGAAALLLHHPEMTRVSLLLCLPLSVLVASPFLVGSREFLAEVWCCLRTT